MGYYQGDYYKGDYYRGDPGLFSFIGKALGGVAKLGASALGLTGPRIQLPPLNFPMIQQPTSQSGLINIGGPGSRQGGLVNIAGRGPMVGPPRGQRANKSTYVTRGGGTSRWPRSLQLHPKGSTMVKSRRMNVANARALRRSIRRVAGFAKIVKRARSAIAKAASAVGVHRGGRRHAARAPSVRIVKAA